MTAVGVPTPVQPQPVVAPLPSTNQVDAVGVVSRESIAQSILRAHKAGLDARRERDLLSEKYLLHIDGSGSFQWADILFGDRIAIPRVVSEYRKTENLLRPIVDNAVAHHTTMPLKFFAESLPDRRSKERAMVDTIWMNHLSQVQDLNGIFADALYMAMATGFCPVHCYWRENPDIAYEPVPIDPSMPPPGPAAGMLDCWTGNPFSHVFDPSAKRGSVYWSSYERIIPTSLLRQAFAHLPEMAGIEGTTKMPSAAFFQRMAYQWRTQELGIHGNSVLMPRRNQETGDELSIVVCREILPGADADYPDGALQLIVVPGAVDLRRGDHGKHAILLTEQALPARDFSWTNVYSHHRFEDVHGKPWVEDLDELQVSLNITISRRWELVNRMIEAPIISPGGAINEDMADIGGYNLLEVEPSLAGWRPAVLEWPAETIAALDRQAEELRRAMYTIGGYQASSRGESPGSRTPYRAIVALQNADNTIHGPVNMRFQRSACDFARRCWSQMKVYGDVPWLIKVVGDDFSYLAEPYIDNLQLSDDPPSYKLINAFGASPEMRAQEILQLMATRGADGLPFLTTVEARRQYPDGTIFDDQTNPSVIQRRRARTIASLFHHLASQFRQQTQMDQRDMADPSVQAAAQQLFMVMEIRYPRLRDDDLTSHIATLTEITQDETADPIARVAAQKRQDLYFQWQMAMAMGAPAAGAGAPSAGAAPEASNPEQSSTDKASIATEFRSGGARSAAPQEAAAA